MERRFAVLPDRTEDHEGGRRGGHEGRGDEGQGARGASRRGLGEDLAQARLEGFGRHPPRPRARDQGTAGDAAARARRRAPRARDRALRSPRRRPWSRRARALRAPGSGPGPSRAAGGPGGSPRCPRSRRRARRAPAGVRPRPGACGVRRCLRRSRARGGRRARCPSAPPAPRSARRCGFRRPAPRAPRSRGRGPRRRIPRGRPARGCRGSARCSRRRARPAARPRAERERGARVHANGRRYLTPGDRDVTRLTGHPRRASAARRGSARARSRPRPPRGCRRRARCRRSSSASPTKQSRPARCPSITPSACVAPLAALGQLRGASPSSRPEVGPEAHHRDVGLVAVLLEEHPLQHLRALEAALGQERRALRQVQLDRVRLGEERAVLELEQGDAAVRVLREELRRARLAAQDVELDALEGDRRAGGAAGGPCSRCRTRGSRGASASRGPPGVRVVTKDDGAYAESRGMRRLALAAALALATAAPARAELLELLTEDVSGPIYLTHAGDDRLFIVEREGAIRVFEGGCGARHALPRPLGQGGRPGRGRPALDRLRPRLRHQPRLLRQLHDG